MPGVAADANGHTGMALAISGGHGKIYIRNSGGTSASTPFWAGIIALADQYASHDLGLSTQPSAPSPAAPANARPSTT